MGDEGAAILGESLEGNEALTVLNLARNQIGNNGIAALGVFLQNNATLTSLDLGSNEISNGGMAALCGVLHDNVTLTTLDISQVGDYSAAAFIGFLQGIAPPNRGRNELSDEDVVALGGFLRGNTTLVRLNLTGSPLDYAAADIIALALEHHPAMRELTLAFNKYTLTAVPESVCRLHCLTELDLNHCALLKSLPAAIVSLPDHQENFGVAGCCLEFPPQSVANNGLADIKQFMLCNYGPFKLLVLVLVARRRCVRHLPDELWVMIQDEFIIY
jgi:Leucine-rich repeat (LRR) protein